LVSSGVSARATPGAAVRARARVRVRGNIEASEDDIGLRRRLR